MLEKIQATNEIGNNGAFSGTTNGGMWNGQFYGPSDDDQPSGVAGEFTANFDNR